MHRITIFLIITNAFFSCKSQTNDEKVLVTAKEAIRNIYEGDFDSFKGKIGLSRLSIIGKNEERLKSDFDYLFSVLSKDSIDFYYNQIIVPDTTNEFDQKIVTFSVPLSDIESVNFKEAVLTLFFGPPQIIPLNKLSGYEIRYLKR
jgi:hypothetical protein